MRPVIYQLVPRYFTNIRTGQVPGGSLAENGCGRFNDLTAAGLAGLRDLGVTHVWLTGVQRQATCTDHSAHGLPADPPQVVKGRAGSFYAVRDVFDVCPDYAVDIDRRLDEFRVLVERIHQAGLRVLMDLVPNHVSRAHSTADAARAFGHGDDRSRFFAPANHFFYLTDPPGQALRLPGGAFAAEDGRDGRIPRATGNNVTSAAPSATDWYETVKLNYGWDFITRRGHYDPRPRTWGLVDALLAHWQALGVDGFRCDFAHYVPPEAWTWLLAQARTRDADAFFMAEAYPWIGSGDPIEDRQQLLDAGFDAVYHHAPYEALKRVYQGADRPQTWWGLMRADHARSDRLLAYLENHDECRIASAVRSGGWSGDSGFGGMAAGYQLAPLHLLAGRGPLLLLNGQELGEAGGANGRTTIFDYDAMPAVQGWVNGHRFDGGGLSADQRRLRTFYGALMHLCQDAVCAGDLSAPGATGSPWITGLVRHRAGVDHALVVLANFRPGSAETARLRVPAAITKTFGATVRLRLVLDRDGAQDRVLTTLAATALEHDGWPVTVPDQSSLVVRVEAG